MTSRRRFSRATKAAIRAYYDHRREMNWRLKQWLPSEWDKQADLEAMFKAALSQRPRIVGAYSMAGTFFFYWAAGQKVTIHDEGNWWRMKVEGTWERVKAAKERT